MVGIYTIVGYDKDNDVYEILDDNFSLSLEAEIQAKKFVALMNDGKLCRDNGEPFDWIEIYHNYNGENETMVWASYEI